jgi:ABC-2 type transport system ATP-binding protein
MAKSYSPNEKTMEAIRAQNLSKQFADVKAVNNLSLSVENGEIFGLVGPDGAGKTTTMRLLTSVMDPTSGDAWILGHHTARESEAVKEEIGYMSQRFGLYPDLTVEENLVFFADLFDVSPKERDSRLPDLLSFSNLTPFKKRYAKNLSGGMKQKLGLACTLIHTPKVLFLDEPTGGVDPVSRRDFWRILYRLLKEGVTIFVSTAYLDEAERCHRVGLLHKGKLLAADTPDGIKKLIGGAILEVMTSEARRAATLLRNILPPETVGLFGVSVHVFAKDAASAAAAIEKQLKENGCSFESIEIIEPSLEDVFVSVVGQKEKEDGS